MSDSNPLTTQPQPPHTFDHILKDVLIMEKKLSSSITRVEERIEKAEVCMKEVKSEQAIIRETQRNIERTLETMLHALRDQQHSNRHVPLASGSGCPVVHRNGIHQFPEHSDQCVDTETAQHSIAGPSRKRRFEEEAPPIAGPSTSSIDRTRKRRKRVPPIQTISEETRVIKKEENEAENLSKIKVEERDELESDTDHRMKDDVEERLIQIQRKVDPKNRTGKPVPPQLGLIFKGNNRCTGCISKGQSECTVLKTPYLMLERYVDGVLSGTAGHNRPRGSACLFCRDQHATFCHLPMTRDKLGPGFTMAHLAGPFPVPKSPERPKENISRVKKARSFSPEFPFAPNTRT